jgi:A/G-specific adenine glycosylase
MQKATRMDERFAGKLFTWYQRSGRELPWRSLADPYAIWISEIMLQQTRVETVIPYFKAWMRTFPTLAVLAGASEKEVLSAWEGLGYYSRARNLLKAARLVVNELGGELPRDVQTLKSLPGIGRYTAGAIASIAFDRDEPALDANIKRVFARLLDISTPANTPTGEKIFWEIARENLPAGRSGEFNQALMDLGAAICTPVNPKCAHCPVRAFCQAYSKGLQGSRPVLKPKKAVPHHIQSSAVILKDTCVLLARRPAKGLLGGMWEFPGGRVEANPVEGLESVLYKKYRLRVEIISAFEPIHHAYTHFKVTVHPFLCRYSSSNGQKDLEWAPVDRLNDYPMGKVDRTIARSLRRPE